MFGIRINRKGYVGLKRPVPAMARNREPVFTWVSMYAYYGGLRRMADRYMEKPSRATLSIDGGPEMPVRVEHTRRGMRVTVL